MAGSWQTVRVFISSTFRDMHAERDHLVKVVFPALRERLEKHRIHLIDIDLRWGVTREQAENDQVLDLCLQQIDECRPFFIGILGERYGWVPTRYRADAIKKFGWIQQHTGKSVTELEILHGVLQYSKMRGRAFFYFRDPLALHRIPEAVRRDIYLDTDPKLIRKLEDLKQQIRQSGCPVVENYPALWDPKAHDQPSRSHGRLVGLEAFGEHVRDQLWRAIQEELQLPGQPPVTAADPLAEEQDYHERFMESRLRVYVGREAINEYLLAFARDDDSVPCLVTGASGSGKSAALARFVADFRRCQPDTLVIPHFVGASPQSTNLRAMLRRFCLMLKNHFNLDDDVPHDVVPLATAFQRFLRAVPSTQRVLFVIDALNQLDETDRAEILHWLPAELPPQVKVVASCIRDPGKPEPILEAFAERMVCTFKLEPLTDVERRQIIRDVPSLSAKTLDSRQVDVLLANSATANPLFLLVALEELRGFGSYEQLNDRIAGLPSKGDTVTALFLQVIDRLEQDFDAALARDLLTLLACARRGLSEPELQELVSHGAGNDDLFPILRQLRPYLQNRAGLMDYYHRNLYKAVRERFLDSAEKQRAAHARLAEYFHGQDDWLEPLAKQRWRLRFSPPECRQANVRKVDELPWQRLQARHANQLMTLLTDLGFCEAKTEAGLVFELVADYAAALERLPREHPLVRRMRLLDEALRRDVHFLARHPTTLFQCLWNSCWWYDCPQAAAHYEAPPGGWPPEGPPWERTSPKLSALLEHWRAAKSETVPGFPWVRSLRPPPVPLGTALRSVFRAHQGMVRSAAFTRDGRRVISGSYDKTARVWEVADGQELACLRDHEADVRATAVSPDGRQFATAGMDGAVRLWDAGTNEMQARFTHYAGGNIAFSPDSRTIAYPTSDRFVMLMRIVDAGWAECRGYKSEIVCLGYAPSGKWLVGGGRDQKLLVWDAQTGQQRLMWEAHDGLVLGVAVSPDEQRIVSCSTWDNSTRIWEAATGKLLLSIPRGGSCVSYSPDGQRIVSADARTLWQWCAQSGECIGCLASDQDLITSFAFAPDGSRLASASEDGTVRVWDADGWSAPRLRGHDDLAWCLAYAPDERRLITGGADKSVRVWDALDGTELHCLTSHGTQVMTAIYSPDGSQIASAAGDQTIRLWDAATGSPIASLQDKGLVSEQALAYSPNSDRIFTATSGETAWIWDARQGVKLIGVQVSQGSARAVAYSADGTRIATGGIDGVVRVWDAHTGTQLASMPGHTNIIHSLSFSTDGRRLASGASDKTVRVWDPIEFRELACFGDHTGVVRNVMFSPDGRRMVSRTGMAAYIWDLECGDCMGTVPGLGDPTAPAMGAASYPWRARREGLETCVERSTTGQALGWFPDVFDERIIADSTGPRWAGLRGNHLFLLQLEGNVVQRPLIELPGTTTPWEYHYCPHCGHRVGESPTHPTCAKCGLALTADPGSMVICLDCGAPTPRNLQSCLCCGGIQMNPRSSSDRVET